MKNKKNKYHIYIILATLLSISCQKFGHHLALETGTLTNKTASGAQVDAMVIDVGESGLTEHGWCIATEPAPTIANTKINNGSKSQYGIYNNEIAGLDPASKYYIKPYITNGSQTVYGEQLELQTEALQFTINTPVANTIWAKGKTFAINWNANFNDKINIDLYKNGTLVKNITQGIENTGSYNWSITNELENGEDYQIIITSSENEIIKAETALFSIYDNAPPGVSTGEASNISYFTAQIGGTLEHFGTEESVLQHGHCWSKNENPTIDDNKTELGAKSTLESFTSDLSELEDNTTYYVRAYAVSDEGVAYGEQKSFTTLDAIPPTVVTSEVTNISYTTATCGGEVTDKGTHDVISRGVCWSSLENPTVDDYKVENGLGVGNYSTNIENLENNTKYYVRAFAINVADTSYGEQVVCATLEAVLPVVVTSIVNNVSYSTATCGGNIQSNGGATIISKGVCWNTTGSPTVNDNISENGIGLGSFENELSGLEQNTTYYIRAYAINIKGISYGEEGSFTTMQRTGTFVDERDNQTYKWVRIGEQVWMGENLRYLPSVNIVTDGSESISTGKFYYVYGYNGDNIEDAKASLNYKVYGVLYNWNASMNGATSSNMNPSNVQGVCPIGWHLPSYDEWMQCVDFLGGTSIAGGKLKDVGISNWISPNTLATNESEFTALPGGYRLPGMFDYFGSIGFWRSSTESAGDAGISFISLYSHNAEVEFGSTNRNMGFSVRCIKD